MLRRRFDRAKDSVSGTNLRESRTKAYPDMNNGHAGATCVIEDIRGASKERILIILGVNRDYASLAIHAKDCGARRIYRRWGGQYQPPFAKDSFCNLHSLAAGIGHPNRDSGQSPPLGKFGSRASSVGLAHVIFPDLPPSGNFAHLSRPSLSRSAVILPLRFAQRSE